MYRVILSTIAVAMLAAMQLTFSNQARAAGGLASFYGADFAGRQTANGEIFNPGALTAASLSLPFGTIVRVTNRYNGRSVTVRINDRGPYIGGRVIDLSSAAASAIGMVNSGVAPVDIQIVGSGARTLLASYAGRRHLAGRVQVAARVHRHRANVQLALASSRHHHGRGKVLLASAKIRHHHNGTAIATGVSTTAEGFSPNGGANY